MNKNNQITESCFHLLQSVILEAFQTEVFFFSPPYDNLTKIDHGLRNMLWPGFENTDTEIVPSLEHPERRIFVVRSNLGFYNIIIYLNFEKKPDFFSIGPFRSEEFSNDFFNSLAKEFHIPASTLCSIQNYYEGLPFVPLLPIVNITKQIVTTFYPEFKSVLPIHAEFTGQVHDFHVNTQMLEDLSSDHAEQYQKALFKFLEPIVKGNIETASNALKDFLRISRFLHSQNLLDCKKNLATLNDYCQIALLGSNVHAAHILKLHTSLSARINDLNSRDAVLGMPNDICHKYCLLVKNYAFPEYSKTVRAVINYIYMHMDEDLSLSLLAKYFNKNATSLSSSFSREVGMNITNFIHHVRINEALRYFNSTKMSISEVALAVGFQDFAYFSRLFHKEVGCSPREYCRKIR